MLNSIKRPSNSPLRDSFFGVIGAIIIAYLLLFGQEILTGTHYLNFDMLANFIWLGVGVMIFAGYEAWKTARA